MSRLFHVTSSSNRASIDAHGLDWRLMGSARGIAGSRRPEADGIFVCGSEDVDFFVGINNTDGPVDVWAVDGLDGGDLVETGTGFSYVPHAIPQHALTLIKRDVPPPPELPSLSDNAYASELTITFDDRAPGAQAGQGA